MDKTFEDYLNDPNIKNIIRSVSNRYPYIDQDERSSIGMLTLWKCIDKYDNKKGTKFTSYLYQQLSYAFKNELKKKRPEFAVDNLDGVVHRSYCLSTSSSEDRKRNRTPKRTLEISEAKIDSFDMLSGLPEQCQSILQQRYFKNMTMAEIANANGYSRETARRRLKKAIKTCRKMNRI